jgi:hypothetical protein
MERPQFRSSEDQLPFTQYNTVPGLSSGVAAMPNCYNSALSVFLQNQVYVPLVSSQMPQLGVDPRLHHSILPPKSEANTYISDSLSSNKYQVSQVATVVTPEAKRRILKKNQKSSRVNSNPGGKLHFPKRVATFSITDFGFPSIQSIPIYSRGTSSADQSVRKGRSRHLTIKTDEISCQRDPFICCLASRSGDLEDYRASPKSNTFSVIPASRLLAEKFNLTKTECLREQWNMQSALRRMGQWTPSGHVTGRWKPPQWAVIQSLGKSNGTMSAQIQKKKKYSGCRKSLLPELDSLVSNFSAEMRMICGNSRMNNASVSLQDVICPQYVRPTINLLCSAHSAVESLLPKGDCEDWEVVAMAWRYYDHWRPRETKVILLAESHAFTSKVSFHFDLTNPLR